MPAGPNGSSSEFWNCGCRFGNPQKTTSRVLPRQFPIDFLISMSCRQHKLIHKTWVHDRNFSGVRAFFVEDSPRHHLNSAVLYQMTDFFSLASGQGAPYLEGRGLEGARSGGSSQLTEEEK
jgi:hypothetical protein